MKYQNLLLPFITLLLLLTGPVQVAHGQCDSAAGPDQTFYCNTDTFMSVTMAATGTGKWTQLISNPSRVTITDTFSPTTTITRFSLPGIYSFIWTDTSTICADTVNVNINDQCECFNLNFSDSTFRGWTGTWGNETYYSCNPPNPFEYSTFNQGPLNFPSNSSARQYSQILTSAAGGNEPYLASLGINIPIAYPGGNGYSARIGNTWPATSYNNSGGQYDSIVSDAESISYTYNVTAANAGFTYYYFTILNEGPGHVAVNQPYLKIRMIANGTDTVNCATFDVDALNAGIVGGFDSINDNGGGNRLNAGKIYYKPWTPVFVPLNNYIGQTIKATFTTRSCIRPNSNTCIGSHFSIAYVYAQCGSAALAVVPDNTCTQNRYIITAPAGLRTYSWSGPGITVDSSGSILVTQSGRYSVTMTPFSPTPCPFSLDTMITIDTILSFKAKFSHDSACLGDTIHFNDLSTPVGQIASWAWDFHNSGTTNSTLQNPSYIFTSAGTYPVKLSVVSTIGCIYDTIIPVTVYSLPTASISQPSSPICGGYNDTLTAHGGITYIWNTGTLTNTNIVSPLIDSTYTVTVTDAHGCSASAAARVTPLLPAPVATITPTSSPFCIGGRDTLTTGVGTSYAWNTGANTISIIVAPTITTKYSVTVTGANGCTANDTVTVRVNPLPTPTISLSAQICSGGNDTLIAGGGSHYVWNNTSNSDTLIVSPTATTTYSVTVTDSNSCSTTTSKTVIVNPLPVATISLSTQICFGNKDTLIAGGGGSYVWSNAATTDTIIVSPTSNTPYSVTVTDANHCIDSITKTVTVVSSPTITIAATSAQICIGNRDTLTASGGGSYAWSNAASTDIIIVSPTTTTSYSVTVTGTNTCTASDTVSVIVNPLPTPMITLTSIQICGGYPDTLIASGGISYVWSNAATTDTAIVSPTTTTQYIVTVTDANSCSDTASKTILVIPSPTPAINPLTHQICLGNSTTLTASGGISYQWSNAANTDTTTVSPSSTTTYSVTVTGANACSATTNATVAVNPIPSLSLGPDTVVCIDLGYIIPGISSASSIVWVPDSALSDPTSVSPRFFTTDSVNYTYMVIAIDTTSGCADTSHLTIGTRTCVSYIIGAQAFTPNGDGTNDHYTLFSSQIASYEIRIYNRWGELVYQSSDLTALNDTSKGWDGTYLGKPQPTDVFVFYIIAKDNFNKDLSQKGNITLLR